MATYTGYISVATSGNDYDNFNQVYSVTGDAITIPSNVKDTATVKVTCTTSGHLRNTSSRNCESLIQICDSTGNNAVTILDKSMTPSSDDYSGEYTKTIDISGLKGKRIYGKNTPVIEYGGSGVHIHKKLKIEITVTQAGTPVSSGNIIKATDRSQTGTATSQGAVMSDSHFSSGEKITASAFNSAYGLS